MTEREIVETVDGRYMVMVNGFQWGQGDQGEPDASGAWPDTWATEAEADEAYRNRASQPRKDGTA